MSASRSTPLKRKSPAAPTSPRYVIVPQRDINADLTCPVCLSVISETCTVKECLHRFCKECIDTSLRMGQKQCPSCRVHCPTRRSLRQDATFDQIIALFHPDLSAQEQEHDRFVQEVIQSHNSKAFALSVIKGTSKQRLQRSKKGKIAAPIEPTSSSIFRRPAKKNGRRFTKPVQVCLQRHAGSTDCGPRARQFFDMPRQAYLSQLSDFCHGWVPESVRTIAFYGVRKTENRPASAPAMLERIDTDNRIEDLEYYFGSPIAEGELLLIYSNAD